MSTKEQRVPLQPVPSWGHQGDSILEPHLGATDYLFASDLEAPSRTPVRMYGKNEDAWRDIMERRLSAGMGIALRKFQVLDWFPRAPGLYYTEHARWARDEAFNHIHHGFRDSLIRDHARVKGNEERPPDYTVVFTPAGKSSMLEGGIGAIRLKPLNIFGEPHWLMTASSDGITHTGLPLAVPIRLYSHLMASIYQYGAVCATLRGELQFVPDPFSRLFDRAVKVPKVLIRVVDLEQHEQSSVQLENSVAVSFVSDYEGPVVGIVL